MNLNEAKNERRMILQIQKKKEVKQEKITTRFVYIIHTLKHSNALAFLINKKKDPYPRYC